MDGLSDTQKLDGKFTDVPSEARKVDGSSCGPPEGLQKKTEGPVATRKVDRRF